MSFLNHKSIASNENLTRINQNTSLKIFIAEKAIGNLFDKEQQLNIAQYFSNYESWKVLCRSLINLANNHFQKNSSAQVFEIRFNSEILTYAGFDKFKLAENHDNDYALCNFLESIKKISPL